MNSSNTALSPSFARPPALVAIRRAASYDVDLLPILRETLREFDLPLQGKSVLLKVNFVCHDPCGAINTHPALVVAAREAFLSLGASSVTIADGPGLERDIEAIAESMRLRDFIPSLSTSLVDLNTDDVHPVALKTRASTLKKLYLPATVLGADLVVSMPKMKTHHWSGVTLSLKNMFGIVPGSCYGWPKNILHWAGIANSILDINSAVRPHFAIVDGITGMEGNGPIQGSPKSCGLLILGNDPVSVDATCARVMGLRPERIDYLRRAGLLLGQLHEEKILQIGEKPEQVRTPFAVLDDFRHLSIGLKQN
ncbi:MAG: DUF362 domain-containing protein [Candidatus Acidiferrales bacterium]